MLLLVKLFLFTVSYIARPFGSVFLLSARPTIAAISPNNSALSAPLGGDGFIAEARSGDLRGAMSANLEARAAAINTFDGHIRQTLDDGRLVYFGYPRAVDDGRTFAAIGRATGRPVGDYFLRSVYSRVIGAMPRRRRPRRSIAPLGGQCRGRCASDWASRRNQA